MSSTEDTLRIEEHEVATQEQAVAQMEEHLEAEEAALLGLERAFKKRNKTLRSLQEYIENQETSLLARAEALGPRAEALATQALSVDNKEAGDSDTHPLGMLHERELLLERRKEILAMRLELVEEREQLYARRTEAVGGAESYFSKAEEKLLSREKVIAGTLRQLITQASELEEEGGDDDESAPDLGARAGPEDNAIPSDEEPSSVSGDAAETEHKDEEPPEESSGQPVVERKVDERDGITVEHGHIDKRPSSAPRSGARTRSEQAETTRRRKAKKAAKQFRITLEAVVGEGEKHVFFRYQADGPSDLPGLFLATPNLLREEREVKLRIRVDGRSIETEGRVSWRRQAVDGLGPPGMGIDIIELSQEDRDHVASYLETTAPMVV